MLNSIKYFEEECISRFEKLEDDFMKELTKLAEYVYGLTDGLHRLGDVVFRKILFTRTTSHCLILYQYIMGGFRSIKSEGKYTLSAAGLLIEIIVEF